MKPTPGVIAIVICNSTDYKYSSNNSNRWNRKQSNSNMKQCNINLAITFLLYFKNQIKILFHYVVMRKYQPEARLCYSSHMSPSYTRCQRSLQFGIMPSIEGSSPSQLFFFTQAYEDWPYMLVIHSLMIT